MAKPPLILDAGALVDLPSNEGGSGQVSAGSEPVQRAVEFDEAQGRWWPARNLEVRSGAGHLEGAGGWRNGRGKVTEQVSGDQVIGVTRQEGGWR